MSVETARNENTECILLLYIRPGEPVCMPKGKDKVVFAVPDERYLAERYRSSESNEVSPARTYCERFSENTKITVRELPKHLDVIDSIRLEVGCTEPFSLFVTQHSQAAGKLIEVFMGMETFEDFLSAAVYCRNQMNSVLFFYALSVAIAHRTDTKHLPIPSLTSVFPHQFVKRSVLKDARQEADAFEPDQRKCVWLKKDHTASDLNIEHRVAYFREDLGISLHHSRWHEVYPFAATKAIVNKPRRGELFYYMHQQILARYNFERFSNDLSRVKSLSDWSEPIPEGYFSKLEVSKATGSWPGRQDGAILKNVHRSNGQFTIQDLERSRDRILEAIHLGFAIGPGGTKIELNNFKGIDILGNIVEATELSVNRTFYGSLHNNGHIAISCCHDPDFRHLEGLGVMGSNATAMRDPVFYRWHAFIDDIFQEHKNLLPPYEPEDLDYRGVKINDVRVTIKEKGAHAFHTFWKQSEVDISGGLDFAPGGSIHVGFEHLNHTPFTYEISVNNEADHAKYGTARIFMAPKRDERGLDFELNEQRLLMIELDKFSVELSPGRQVIKRRSDESSVTIPFKRTFPNFDEVSELEQRSEEFNYCGCGWPQHMLIPKGNSKGEGLPVDLFVMISDRDVDMVKNEDKECCRDAVSYCGLKDKEYPDSRSMGYPFDRPSRKGIKTLGEFVTNNMRVVNMNIVFQDNGTS